MAFVKKDRVRETTITTGTGSITTTGAPVGFQSFGSVMSVGDTCWYAIIMPGVSWETGTATYTGTNTLARTTVYESSNAGSIVSFTTGSKDIFICQPASQAQPAFPSGTSMLFQQTSAPIYWTKQTLFNDYALRVVSGAASSGGFSPFSSTLNTTLAVGNTTITQSTSASHQHAYTDSSGGQHSGTGANGGNFVGGNNALTTVIGSDGSHNHTLAINIAYVDLIICHKD